MKRFFLPLAVFLLALTLAWHFAIPMAPMPPPPESSEQHIFPQTLSQSQVAQQELNRLERLNPWRYPKKGDGAVADVTDPDQHKQRIEETIRGLVRRGDSWSALFEEEDGTIHRYGIGDKIASGEEISAMGPGTITLRQGQKTYSIKLYNTPEKTLP